MHNNTYIKTLDLNHREHLGERKQEAAFIVFGIIQ